MLGSGGFIVYNDTFMLETWNFSRFITIVLRTMYTLSRGTGWLEKYCTESKLVLDVKRILICCGVFNQN
jgi:hypothetical protein